MGWCRFRDRELRGVPGCEQRHVPSFLTLLGVTRSGLRELHEHAVECEKYKSAQEPKNGRPVRYPGKGPHLRRAIGAWAK